MKYIFFVSGCLILLACSSSSKKGTVVVPVAAPETKNVASVPVKSTYELHPYSTETLPNGLQIVFIEDHSLPSVSYGMLVRDGSASDPMAKAGLMHLMVKAMARGTTRRTASQIADQLGQLGSEYEDEVSNDFSWFEVSGLSIHSKKLLDIFSDVLLHPRFEPKEIEREKSEALAKITRRSDHPDHFAAEAFEAYLFGGHPYARPILGLEADVRSVSRRDLMRAYFQIMKPNNSILIVSGDFSPEIQNNLRGLFGAWEKREKPLRTFSEPPGFSGINIRLIDKPDLTQSQIVMGHLGIKREDPDFLKLRIANIILGGNFTSRLMDRVRVNLGLTYGISSSFDSRLDRGPFDITTFTKNQSVGATISESLKVYKKFYDEGVTAQEVEAAKNFLIGSFPRAVETSDKLGYNLAILRLYGISDDYLRNFINVIESFTTSDINDAIKRHFIPGNLKILVLTKSSESLDQVRPLGLVEVKKFNEVF